MDLHQAEQSALTTCYEQFLLNGITCKRVFFTSCCLRVAKEDGCGCDSPMDKHALFLALRYQHPHWHGHSNRHSLVLLDGPVRDTISSAVQG